MKFEVGKKYHNTSQGTVNGKIVYYVCQWTNHEKAVLALEHMAYDDVREAYKLLPVTMRGDGPWVEYKGPVVHSRRIVWWHNGDGKIKGYIVLNDEETVAAWVYKHQNKGYVLVELQEITYTENR